MTKSRFGFTLIELLVVMSLIGVLLAMLLPALRKARGQARLIQCASHQRQVLIAYTAYAYEHKDHIPRPLIGSNYDAVMFMQWHSGADRLYPVGIGVLYATKFMANPRAGACTDHPSSNTTNIVAGLEELYQNGKYLAAPSGGWSYLFRAPSQADTQYNGSWRNLPGNANQVTNVWPNWVRRWNSYAMPIATKLDANLPGGRITIEANPANRVIRSPLSVILCRTNTVYHAGVRGVHGNDDAFNASFADGAVFQVDYSVRTSTPARASDVFFNFADRRYPGWRFVQQNRDNMWR